MVNQDFLIGGISPFRMTIRYLEMSAEDIEITSESHVHAECEIYINLSGDVSFMVENSIYPIDPGNVIITRPFEYHHCIYHSKAEHKHYWILFQPGDNKRYLDLFFDRMSGQKNRLCLSAEDQVELISLCNRMLEKPMDEVEVILLFFKLISLLQNGSAEDSVLPLHQVNIRTALHYISEHFHEQITVQQLAEVTHTSINTLERSFKQHLGVTPSSYLRKKRLSNALRLLSEGYSVTEAAENSGFGDYSSFIQLFRKAYGITPLSYKKRFDANKDTKSPAI